MKFQQILEHIHVNILESNISNIYNYMEKNYSYRDPFFSEMESEWIGGVADFGNPQAALVIQRHHSYPLYHRNLVRIVKKELGDPFVAYRLLAKNQLEEWKQGFDLPPMGVSTSQKHAESFRRFARNIGREDLILVRLMVPASAVVMLGHEAEQELVIDPNEISYHEVQIVESTWSP
jgi:hypothetical protein